MYINDAMSKIDCIQIPSIDTRGATRGAKYQGGQISPGGVVVFAESLWHLGVITLSRG
jgi:hypothetical protein